MNKLVKYANRYVKKSDWKDVALIKACLCSLGIVVGASLSEKSRKPVKQGAKIVFAVAYVPIMLKALIIFAAGLPEDRVKKQGKHAKRQGGRERLQEQ